MLARLDGFDAKSGRTRRKRYERRDDETRRCAAGRRFLFVAPFSVAHPCRQGKGIRLLFFSFAPSLPLARSIVPVSSGRIVSSPFRGSVAGRASWRGAIRLGWSAAGFWLLVSRLVHRLALVSRQAVRVLSFRPGVSSRRLVGRVVSSLSCSLLFSDHSFAASHGHGNGRRLVICGLVSLVSLRRATSWNPIG